MGRSCFASLGIPLLFHERFSHRINDGFGGLDEINCPPMERRIIIGSGARLYDFREKAGRLPKGVDSRNSGRNAEKFLLFRIAGIEGMVCGSEGRGRAWDGL
jgi:hypothetical protein